MAICKHEIQKMQSTSTCFIWAKGKNNLYKPAGDVCFFPIHNADISLLSRKDFKSEHVPFQFQMSHEKNPPTFHYTGWLIGILIMVYYFIIIPK